MINLNIGGLTPFTMIDYPGKMSAVIFLQHCTWNCTYCHNKGLIPKQGNTGYSWQYIHEFLISRIGKLDAVVFSGGEPLLQNDLIHAMLQVKAMGFSIGLHTSGVSPKRLEKVLPVVDWVGFDIKAAFADYETITGKRNSGINAKQSLEILLASGVDYELRTVIDNDVHTDEMIDRLRADLKSYGVESIFRDKINKG